MARTLATQARKTNARARTANRRSAATRTRAAVRSPATRTDPGLQTFLDGLTKALTAGDGEAAARCFEYPAIMVMADSSKYGPNQVLAEPGTVAGFFGQAPEQYHARGIEQTFADVEGVQWLAPDLAWVRVRFPYLDADGNDMGDSESSVYVVRKSSVGYAICAAVALGVESDKARGARAA